jgi:hypothetical protein
MACARCSSLYEAEFSGEIMLHFVQSSPARTLDPNPGVLTFSMISVCLDCGASRFNMPTEELWLLRESAA